MQQNGKGVIQNVNQNGKDGLQQLAAVAPSTLPAVWTSLASAAAGTKTLTAVMQSDLRVTDPGFTTAIITRDHGYMVYDTLLGQRFDS